ncbi:MAG: hypothetical protein QF443_02345, partial [Dehalococcoidia bacterium]|nr:hypothetical protein [Dehalococcoidia bacterium]
IILIIKKTDKVADTVIIRHEIKDRILLLVVFEKIKQIKKLNKGKPNIAINMKSESNKICPTKAS